MESLKLPQLDEPLRGVQSLPASDTSVLDVEVPDTGETVRPWYGPDSTGASLLEVIKSLPPWAGDDFEDVLEDVIRSRSQARF